MARKLLNFVLFQVGWFACVLSGAHDASLVAVAAACAVIGVSLCWSIGNRLSDIRLFLAVALIGFCVDTAHQQGAGGRGQGAGKE